MSLKFDVDDFKTWFYFPIEMPVDKDGHGPADFKDTIKMTYEVWDQNFETQESFDYLYEAITRAIHLNKTAYPKVKNVPEV